MTLAISLIITAIAIGLLGIYGADVIIGYSTEGGEGFIPFDHKTRGIGLGMPALILPIAAYFISRKTKSKALGGMIIVAGALIILGGLVVIANSHPGDMPDMVMDTKDQKPARNAMSEAAPLIIVGVIQIALGALKIKKS